MIRRTLVAVVVVVLAALAASSGHSGAASATTCTVPLHTVSGWEAVFGYRTTRTAAETLRVKAGRAGFKNLVIEKVGCPKWAVALHGLTSKRQGRELAAEAKPAGFKVVLVCHPVLDLDGDWQAVFGYFKTRTGAEAMRTRAGRAGFRHLDILRNICTRKWYVELDGLQTLAQARDFQAEAKHAGFDVTIKHH
jgi:cell division septation protein DedD